MSVTDSNSRPVRAITISGSNTLDSNWVNVYLGFGGCGFEMGGGGGGEVESHF